ncbi:ABC transporter permease [Methylopila henanensis]|uniref:ABC transporter permease n=1 Tax=Methylopila henanensis TaxID=873516 RepID=A0ABW4K1R6_9HYPH
MENLPALLSFGAAGWGDELLAGVGVTLALALATLPLGLALGLFVTLAKASPRRPLRAFGEAYTTVFRGLPELLTIVVVYYGGQILLNAALARIAPGTSVQIGGFAAGVAALALVFGAFASEAMLGALRSLPRGQMEAAAALGLPSSTAFRLVALPQLWRLALPGLSNCWLVLLKDTSLVSVIALTDLMRQTTVAAGATKQPFIFYLVACLAYLTLSLLSGRVSDWLQRRADHGFATAGR